MAPRPDNTYFDPATCTMYTTQSSRTALKSKLPRPTDLTPMETQLLRDLDHINETLTLEEMKAKEPYFPLPKQYYPRRKLQHQPPIFTFGVVFSLQELKEYAAAARVVGEGHITGKVIYHFNQKLDMPEGYGIFMDIARFADPTKDILFGFRTSSRGGVPKDRMKDAWNEISSAFPDAGEPRWWISSLNLDEYLEGTDFRMPAHWRIEPVPGKEENPVVLHNVDLLAE